MQNKTEQNASLPGEQPESTPGSELLVKEKRDILVFPAKSEVTVSPEMSDNVLVLDFSPGVERFELPDVDTSKLIREIRLKPEGKDKVSQMEVVLESETQFLLSRPGGGRMQLMLAKSGKSADEAKDPGPETEIQDSFAGQKADSEITGIDFFADENGFMHIKLSGSGGLECEPVKSPKDRIVLDFAGAKASSSVAKMYRLEKFGSQLKSAHVQNRDRSARMVISVEEKVPMQVASKGENELEFVFMSENGQKKAAAEKTENATAAAAAVNATPSELAGVEEGAEQDDTLFPGMKEEYSGQKISLDLQDADVEHVLRLIASVKDYNLIIDDSVQGSISLRLVEVPWEQALDLVLLQRGLVKIQKGNILRITSVDKREQELAQMRRSREAEMQAKKSMEEHEELKTEYVQINYAKAKEMQPQVQEFLSERGKISHDPRSNMLIVSDVRSNLEKIKSVVQKLDQPERQVLIEARIVYATDEFSRSLGVNWGALYPTQSYQGGNQGPSINPSTGDPSYPSAYTEGQYQKGMAVDTSGVNTPTVGGLDVAGSIAKIAGLDLFTLDAELQLGESQGVSRTVSSPRVMTLNNEEAEIVQGTQIRADTESESGGTTVEYVEAVLSLKVTPQITPDDKLILELEVSDDSPAGDGDIETKSAQTKLIVDDGETLVLGGVRKIERNEDESKVPGIGDVPLLGWLFKSEYKQDRKDELLIFIRPTIM
ncbi:MAG: type IV pilus secretin PilQ [Desulfonatronovibrionaceae bacterium]